MEFPPTGQNNHQLKLERIAFNRSGAIAVPAFRREELASSEQMLSRIRRVQREGRNLSAAGAVEAGDLKRLFQMQFPRLAKRIDAAVIVDPVSQIGVFLDFTDDHARENSMLRSSLDEIGIT